MHLQRHYQNAYVTRDLDKAIEFVGTRYGIEGLFPIDIDLDVATPAGTQKLSMRLAYTWIGVLNFELIQPVAGCVDHYVASLPDDKTDYRPRFNHVALRRDKLDEMRAEIQTLALPTLFEGAIEGLRYIYVDARPELGHLLEYVWATPEVWQVLGWPA